MTGKLNAVNEKIVDEKVIPEKKKFKKNVRDPFSLPSKTSKNNARSAVKLLGIVYSAGKCGAVLEFEGKAETVFLNDKFFGFKVLEITPNYVELIRGKTRKRLFLND